MYWFLTVWLLGAVGTLMFCKDVRESMAEIWSPKKRVHDRRTELLRQACGLPAPTPSPNLFKEATFVIVVVTVLVLGWPIFGGEAAYSALRKRRRGDSNVLPDGLSFMTTNGVGQLRCGACGQQHSMVSFEHGGPGGWRKTGYQCQRCQKLHAVENDDQLAELPHCGCGGNLSRAATILCPSCASSDVSYQSEYMT